MVTPSFPTTLSNVSTIPTADYRFIVGEQMRIVKETVRISTQGNADIIDITDAVNKHVAQADIANGLATLFIAGATGGITTIEYEPGLVKDLQQALERLAPQDAEYFHNITHADCNGHSHVRASIIGPSLSIPLANHTLQLGQWQQIIFVDLDNRPRQREILLQILGE